MNKQLQKYLKDKKDAENNLKQFTKEIKSKDRSIILRASEDGICFSSSQGYLYLSYEESKDVLDFFNFVLNEEV